MNNNSIYERVEALDSAASAPNSGPPVYSLGPGASAAVPTGDVLVRFADGIDAAARADALAEAGYEIVRTLPYNANAAVLRARSGSPADALAGLGRLEALPDVVNVEPQMVTERAFRAE